MLAWVGPVSDVAPGLRPRVRNSEGTVSPVHHVHGVAGFREVGRFLDGEEGRSGRGSAVRIASLRAHVVGGGERKWHVAKQRSKRKDRRDAADYTGAGALSDADRDERCSDFARRRASTS